MLRKKWFRVSLAIAIVLAAVLAWNWRPADGIVISAKTTYITAPLDAQGMPDYVAYLNQRLAEGVTPANNIEAGLRPLLGDPVVGIDVVRYTQALGIPPLDRKTLTLVSIHEYGDKYAGQIAAAERAAINAGYYTKYPWNVGQPTMQTWLAGQTELLDAAVAVIESRDRFYMPLLRPAPQASLMEVVLVAAEHRQLVQSLAARAMHAIARGDGPAAFRDAHACLKLSRLMGQASTLIEFLVGIALERQGLVVVHRLATDLPLTREQVDAMKAQLAALPPRALVADKIDLGERLFFLDTIIGLSQGKQMPSTPQFIGGLDWNYVLEQGNTIYDRLVAATRNRDATLWQALDAEIKQKAKPAVTNMFSRRGISKQIFWILVAMIVPSLESSQAAYDRVEAEFLIAQTALSLRAYHTTTGTWPDSLAALVPDYLPAVPTDPVTKQPLAYERTAEGWRLRPGEPDPKKADAAGLSTDPDRGCQFPAPAMPAVAAP